MSKIWITADWHLGEDRFELMGRPFKTQKQMVDTLIANHNSLVAPDDLVYLVGDVCYQKTPEFLPYAASFNGVKHLFRGNHDRVFTDQELSKYFDIIIPEGEGVTYTVANPDGDPIDCWITHYPSRGSDQLFNLVGHIHSAWKYQLNSFNVGVDCNHFYPHDLNDAVVSAFNAINTYYDNDVWVAYLGINADYRGKRGKPGTYFS